MEIYEPEENGASVRKEIIQLKNYVWLEAIFVTLLFVGYNITHLLIGSLLMARTFGGQLMFRRLTA